MESNKQRNNKIFELAVSVFFLCVSVYMIYVAQNTGKPTTDGSMTSMAFPKAIYIVIIALCAYLIVMNLIWFKNHPKDPNAAKVPMVPSRAFSPLFSLSLRSSLEGDRLHRQTLFFFSRKPIVDRKKPFWLTLVIAVCACA
jgi:hypothetical protein